jgi:hypothetical protein
MKGRDFSKMLAVLVAFSLLAALAVSCAGSPNKGNQPDSFTSASTKAGSTRSILEDLPAVQGAGKTLVVYFTGGNISEGVAKDLAALYSADIERIVELRTRRGFWGYMGAGMDASFGTATPIAAPSLDPSAYDTVIVCSPVWSWHLAPPVRSWLRMFKGKLPRAAFATISGDTKPDKIAAAMAKEGGRQPFAVVGFDGVDFEAENRATYLGKMAALCVLP